MAWSPHASSIPLLPPPGGGGPALSPREDAALQRLLLELRADLPPEPGPGHVSHRGKFSEVLAALGHLAIGGDPIEPLLASACRLVAETLSVDAVVLFETTAAADRLVVRAAAGSMVGTVGEPVSCGAGTQAGFALDQLGSTATADVQTAWPTDSFLSRHGLAAAALVMVPGPAGPLGLLGAYEAGFRAFEPGELRFLEAAGTCLSAAIAHHRSELERQRLYARLAVADRMVSVGTLAGGVAHELNNPLSYVTANLAFISEEVARLGHRLQSAGVGDPSLAETAAELVEAAADARDGVEKLRGLVRDLQTLSRGDDSVLAPLDLTHVLESAISVARSEIKHRATVERQLATSLPPVRANEARLGQVFLNLLVNAAHAIPAGQPSANLILVRSYVAPGWRVAIEVTDTGCGIPAEQLERIFDPFYSTKAPGTGAGLGLPICRSIVTALGGELVVESRVGVGSTFRVLLPVVPAERPQEPARPAPAPAPTAHARILVVDDEPLVGAVLQRTLGGEFDLTCVGGPREALALLEGGQRYDLILSDLSMPGMTGMELHGVVAQLSPAQAGRMIFLSGGAFTAAARDFLARPGMVCIEKPFELDALRAVIAGRLAPG